MSWYLWFGFALALLIVAIVGALADGRLAYKRKRILTPHRILILGTFLSATLLFCPLYLALFTDSVGCVRAIKSLLVSVQHAIRLFAFDGGYWEFFQDIGDIEGQTPVSQMMYTGLGAVLYFFAPMLTFTFILSLFKNLWAYIKYILFFWKDAHVFSELNEKSIALARSIDEANNKDKEGKYRTFRRATIVFTDVLRKDDEASLDLLEDAKEIGAVLFTKDLESIRYRNQRFSCRKVSFYLISEDEKEKIRHAESIIAEYKDIPQTKLYLFSDHIESKCFLDSYTKEDRKNMSLVVMRVNDIRALVYQNLLVNGIRLFENANPMPDGTREISAVVVGLGRYGMEMVKALLWYTQIPGYRVKITAFDEKSDAASAFKASCPEIQVNTAEVTDIAGDMRYTVCIKEGKFGTESFYSEIEKIGDMTYLFVCLGDDRQNISATLGISNWLAKYQRKPYTETVVYDSSLKKRIEAGEDFAKREIHMIGDLESFYSVGTVINSKLIAEGLEVHKRWDTEDRPENRYYMNDYNFYSSLASGLHRKLRRDIIAYSSNSAAATVFPFYHAEQAKETTLKKILSKLNDNRSIREKADVMKMFADCLYAKLAHLHYQALASHERKEVLEGLAMYLDAKKKDIKIPMVDDTAAYLRGYDEWLETAMANEASKTASRAMFDRIVAIKTKGITDEQRKRETLHSLEYFALSEKEKAEVAEYVKRGMGYGDDSSFRIDDYLEEGRCFAEIEHVRWNAYMRTEGFRRAIDTDKPRKLHYDLVPTNLLTFADCIKDL